MTREIGLGLGLQVGFFLLLLGGLSAYGITPAVMQDEGWWIPFLIANGGALVGHLAMAWILRRPDADSDVLVEGLRQDLVDNRALVVQQLRVLDAERDKLSPEDYAAERQRLVEVGARAARALEEGLPGDADSHAAATPASPSVRARLLALRTEDPAAFDAALAELGLGSDPGAVWRGAGGMLLVALLAGGFFVLAGQDARTRAPGGTMTGGDQVEAANQMSAEAAGAASPAADPVLEDLRRQAAERPDDLSVLNPLTERCIAAQDLQCAMETNQQALEAAPEDPVARTYRAVLLAFIGRRDEALSQLEAISTEHPDTLEAWIYQGLLTMSFDPARATVAFEKALALDDNPQIRQALAQARARLESGDGAAPEPPASPAGGEALATGTIRLADGQSADGAQALFVYLRDPSGGPPLGAKKLPPGPFPMALTFTRADLLPMAGRRPLPETVTLGARLDGDGNAMSREPLPTSADLSVSPGVEGVELVLEAP